jgi:glucose-1-phosphate cytidylyltransferase
MRLRDSAESAPKPMVPIGYRPILWHIMKYYAHFGHTEFILCLGHQAHTIKDYFLNYSEALSNDFVLSKGGTSLQLLGSDIQDWRVTFVNTGLDVCVGQRLVAVRDHIGDDDVFLANYADGLSDIDINAMIRFASDRDSVACFAGVEPNGSFHVVESDEQGRVHGIHNVAASGIRINGGFFVLKREIFDYIHKGEELVEEPFQRLIEAGKLLVYHHDGFWACMDTFKERQQLVDLYSTGSAPWTIWENGRKT